MLFSDFLNRTKSNRFRESTFLVVVKCMLKDGISSNHGVTHDNVYDVNDYI